MFVEVVIVTRLIIGPTESRVREIKKMYVNIAYTNCIETPQNLVYLITTTQSCLILKNLAIGMV